MRERLRPVRVFLQHVVPGFSRGQGMPVARGSRAVALILMAVAVATALGQSAPSTARATDGDVEAAGSVGRLASKTLPAIGPHFVWVADAVFQHNQLYDGDTGAMLATIDSSSTISPKPPLYSPARAEFYSVEIDYDRGRRGNRTDFVTIYDAKTLAVTGDIVFPTRAGESASSMAYIALLDDDRFLGVFNHFPVTSVSIIDLETRSFVAEVPTAGCAGIYPVGERAWSMLCGNGTVHVFHLDESGRLERDVASAPFFDAVEDPAMLSGGRIGSTWFFATFSGRVHEVDFSSDRPVIETWSLVGEADRAAGWVPGGRQLFTANAATGQLYGLFHQGGSGTHKDPGPEVWIFDVAARERVMRAEVPNLTAAFLGDMMQLGDEGFVPWLLNAMIPNEGADTIAVSRDAKPLIFVRHSERGSVAILDGATGAHLRNLTEVGLGGTRLTVP